MRTIEFRGLDEDYKIWRYGSVIVYENGDTAITDTPSNFGGRVWSGKVIPETVGQYTGIRDNNGIPIYEGDIIKDKLNKELHVIEYDDKTTQFTAQEMWVWALVKHPYFGEVVGNIHENPELLEVE